MAKIEGPELFLEVVIGDSLVGVSVLKGGGLPATLWAHNQFNDKKKQTCICSKLA